MSELETLVNMLYQRDQEEMDAMQKKLNASHLENQNLKRQLNDYKGQLNDKDQIIENDQLEKQELRQKIAELELRINNDLKPQPA